MEDVSGEVLIAYENSSALANSDLEYRIWNGSLYSAPQLLRAPLANSPIRWVKMFPRAGSDDIMLLVHNNAGDLHAFYWDGNQFGTTANLTLSLTTASSVDEHFGFAWEGTSDDGLVVYGTGTDLVYRTFSITAPYWSTEATIALGKALASARLCTDQSSDYIGIIVQDGGADVNVRMWDGTQILASPPTEELTTEPKGANNANADCVWHNSSTAVFGFVDSTALAISYTTFTKTNTWGTTDLNTPSITPNFASDDIHSLRFTSHPTTSEFMAISMDLLEDVTAIRWNGTNFTGIGESPLEINTEVLNGDQEGAMFDWFRYDPVPNVTSISPNNLNFPLNTVIDVNATVIDNLFVGTVLANITLPNSTVRQITLINRSGNNTHYNFSFSSTDLRGVYTLRIIANDTSKHQNVNLSETVTFSVGDVIIPNVTNVTPIAGTNFPLNAGVNITANVTDNVNISTVFVNITLPNGSISQIQLFNRSMFTYNGTFSVTENRGTYSVRIIANDTSNNINNSETTTFSIGDIFPPNVTDITPVSGSNFSQNSIINITVNVSDGSVVSVVLANITLPNGTISQVQLLNRSLYQYNASFTITSIQGTYTVKIIANDTLNNINSSENTTFSLGDIAVPTIVLNAPANYSNHSSTSIIFNFTATDDVSAFLNCSILINQTVNQTNNSVVSTADTLFNISGFLDASYSWNVTCNDSSGKNGSSEIRIFNIDTHPPQFQSLVTVPSDEANLDPNANITALANVTDNTTSVQTVILQYKLSNNSEFTNLTLPLYSNSNLYNNSFNATQNGTYNLRLWANDSVGNAAFSNLINIGVVLEKNWTRTPVSFPAVRTTLNSNVSVGNLTINNTGDFALHFNISSTSNETYYNASSNFTLQAGEVRAIEVLDNGSASGIKTLTLNITVNDSEARPQSLTTTGTIVVAPGQPLLVATFTEPDADTLAVTQGDTNILFAATLNNIGEGNASNVSFFFTIPEEWTVTFGSTSESLTELLSGESEDNVFEVTIPSNATAGTYKVYVNATGINASGANLTTINLTFGDVITVTVNQAAEILGTAGGGGAAASTAAAASSAAGGGGGGAGTVTKVPRETIDFPEEYVSVPRSTSYTIPVTVTNTWINATLKDISLVLEGFLAQQVQVSPSLI